MKRKPYFHELTDDEYKVAVARGCFSDEYQQPPWCTHSNALDWYTGCWALTERKKRCSEDCRECPMYKEK